MRVAREGLYWKSAQNLGSLGVLLETKTVSVALRTENPQSPQEDKESFEPHSVPPEIQAVMKTVRQVERYEKGSGRSGLPEL